MREEQNKSLGELINDETIAVFEPEGQRVALIAQTVARLMNDSSRRTDHPDEKIASRAARVFVVTT